MRSQKVNPNNINPMQMKNISSMMGMMNSIQKIGKSKRKYTVNFDKGVKKFLSKFIEEVKKQFVTGQEMPNIVSFLDYIKNFADNKEQTELKLSYEELEFLKRMISDAVKGMETVKFKWYQFMKKSMTKLMLRQYKEILAELKK